MSSYLINEENLSQLRELQTVDDPNFLREYFTALLEPFPRRISAMKNALAAPSDRSSELAREAHAMKSACTNAGIEPIVAICKKLEMSAATHENQANMALVEELEELYACLKREVRRLF